MPKATYQTFKALADKHGIDVEYCSGGRSRRTGKLLGWTIVLDAPNGKVFAGSGTHSDFSLRSPEADEGEVETKPDWDKQVAELQEIINTGMEECSDEECDVCE